jgi:hypothetical protein
MSNTVALTGNDTITINGRNFNDFATGIVAEIQFPNDLVNMKTGKGGNTLYALNNTGRQSEVNLKVVIGSADDAFLNALLLTMQSNFAGFTLMTGTFVKNVGDGNGNIKPITYVMSGGVLKRNVNAVQNADGEPDQSLSEWHLMFSNAPRGIG